MKMFDEIEVDENGNALNLEDGEQFHVELNGLQCIGTYHKETGYFSMEYTTPEGITLPVSFSKDR